MWVIMGFDGKLQFNGKFNLSPTTSYEFMGSGPEYRSDCRDILKLGIKDAFVLTYQENVVYNTFMLGKRVSAFEKVNFLKDKVKSLMFRFSLNVIDNNFPQVFRVYEKDSKLFIDTGVNDLAIDSKEWGYPNGVLWNNQEAIKLLIKYLYDLMPRNVLIENLYISKDIVAIPRSLESHSLYVRKLSDSLVDCCIFRSDLKDFVVDRSFALKGVLDFRHV